MPKLLPFKEKLKEEGACEEALKWVNSKSKKSAWNRCKHDDWMMWFLNRTTIDKGPIVLALYEMMETELDPLGRYPQKAIALGRKWLKKEISLDTLNYNHHECNKRFHKKDDEDLDESFTGEIWIEKIAYEFVNPDSTYSFLGLYDDLFYEMCRHQKITLTNEKQRAPLEKRLCDILRKNIPVKLIEKAKWKK